MTFGEPLLFQYIFLGETIIFTFCIMAWGAWSRSVKIWLASNLLSVAGGACVATSFVTSNETLGALGGGITIIAGCVKSICFSSPHLWRKSNFIPNVFTITGFGLGLSIIILVDSPLRFLLVTLGGMSATLACLFYMYANKMWVGLRPVFFTAAVLVSSLFGFVYLLLNAYPIGSNTRFAGTGTGPATHLILLCVFMFLFHMAFIGLTVARQNREQFLQLRRLNRIQAVAERSMYKEQQSAALAEERNQLLKMLTHEVRQPLNTAQAALQIVVEQLGRARTARVSVQQNVVKAQSTLNAIVLSISNSILGATMITEGRPIQLRVTDLCEVAQLALTDLNPLQSGRIQPSFEEPAIFAEADPIILRLAIRNLLDNALKYSPPDTPILFELAIDEEKMALVIRVTNELVNPLTLNADIFQLNKRGVDSTYEGSGLGLYIVKKVAKMHNGDLDYHIVNENQVVFELTIPG